MIGSSTPTEPPSEEELDAIRTVRGKRLGRQGLPEDRDRPERDETNAREAPESEPPASPTEDVIDPDPARIRER